ncbi:MAG: hypothetical protein FWF66_06520 [Candidatus Bathyarchaeota archaeon]|nr:hypothetical protein [Candidatus Termiticorpusculum sp.]MCL1971090.1 hypothetical protein [Candidatus Termiticorpusculum sp.]
MGRRRKKSVHIPKKRLPTFFSCPVCGKETVSVEINREGSQASAQCSSCTLREDFQIKQAQDPVDVYCMLTDRIYSTLKRAPIAKTKDE